MTLRLLFFATIVVALAEVIFGIFSTVINFAMLIIEGDSIWSISRRCTRFAGKFCRVRNLVGNQGTLRSKSRRYDIHQVVYGLDFMDSSSWQGLQGGGWQLGPWSQWVKNTNETRYFVISVPMLPTVVSASSYVQTLQNAANGTISI